MECCPTRKFNGISSPSFVNLEWVVVVGSIWRDILSLILCYFDFCLVRHGFAAPDVKLLSTGGRSTYMLLRNGTLHGVEFSAPCSFPLIDSGR